MRAMILTNYGGTAKFSLEDIPKPHLKSGQVLINIAASSVNTVDTMIRSLGDALPLSPQLPALVGMDFAGTVEAVGEDVSGFQPGDEVYGCAGGLADLPGTLADYIAADARLFAHKPRNLSMVEAAAIPLAGITAYEGLVRAGVCENQRVLVHGGSGGVGHLAVQIAQYFGASVYATGGGDRQLSLIKELGATGINYKKESVASYVDRYTDGQGFDVVLDSVSGLNMLNLFEATQLNGHVASTVSLCELDLSTAHFKGLSLHVVFMLIPMLHNIRRHEHHEILTKLAQIAEANKLKPVIDHEPFPLTEGDKAYDRLHSKQGMGKVIIVNA